MEMSSASAVINDCDGVAGEQSHCTLCKQPLRGIHTVTLDSGKVSYSSSSVQ